MKTALFILPVIAFLAPTANAEVVDSTTRNEAPQTALPEGELRIRSGIIILGKICQYLAEVKDLDTAEAAVPRLMTLLEEMQAWSHSFNNLPPLSEVELLAYEERYLPTIRKINSILEAQAARIAAAEYYGSRNLPAVLVRFAQLGQP